MESKPKIKLYSVVIDCIDLCRLAEFYAKLIGWETVFSDAEYAVIGAPGSRQGAYPGITFQYNPDYERPVWPEKSGTQQQMEHLDFAVDDLEGAVRHAVDCGATIAAEQFSEHWRVILDPEGHPFCLCEMKHILDSVDCRLM